MEKQYQKKGINVSDNRKFLSKTEAGRLTTKKRRTKRKIYDIQNVILQRGRKIEGKFVGSYWLIPCLNEWVER